MKTVQYNYPLLFSHCFCSITASNNFTVTGQGAFCAQGSPGMNGMPGKNGIPGHDGKVGMPGRDGEHRVIFSVVFN